MLDRVSAAVNNIGSKGNVRRRWVDNIGMDLQEVGCGYMD